MAGSPTERELPHASARNMPLVDCDAPLRWRRRAATWQHRRKEALCMSRSYGIDGRADKGRVQ
jgi:hypothetical protein